MLNRTYVSDSSKEVGKEITVYGWVNSTRDHGNLIFFDLRDMTGLLQVVVNKESAPEAHKAASKLSSEDVLQVTGVIKNRAEKYINSNIVSGSVEMEAKEVGLINKSLTPPFDVTDNGQQIDESLRLKYRYLDLRRPRMKKNIQLRHKVISFMRQFLNKKEFIEIETPILTKATPEGARDFLV